MTHVAKLLNCGDALAQFFDQITGLDEKLGPVLLQFAPGHTFEKGIVRDFLGALREINCGSAALKPRNASWFTPEADQPLREFEIARVAPDPAKGSSRAAKPGRAKELRYYRLRGSRGFTGRLTMLLRSKAWRHNSSSISLGSVRSSSITQPQARP